MTPRRLGLTGSIGSGKSTVAHLLRARGLPVLDADAAAHAVSSHPATLAEVAAQLGPQYVQPGGLHRPALAELVFRDPDARATLNGIIHPRVRAHLAAQEAQAAQAGAAWVVQDVPLLFEGGLDASMDATLLVDAPLDVRVARVTARDGLRAEQVLARDAAQMPGAEKRRRATITLENDGDLAHLERQLDAALTALGVPTTPPSSAK
ncbi:dephospho-CoA kinase [Deinococcus maricopensis]|nr:dephospho-CoA kinase [Deinococcus maricopensis]